MSNPLRIHCARYLVVHDFDKSGLEILHKFTADTRRFTYTIAPTVIDLGLRLEDALAMGLESEPVRYDSTVDPRESLRECGGPPSSHI